MTTPSPSEAGQNRIVEYFTDGIQRIKMITVYERTPDGGRGKRLSERVEKDGEVVSLQRWEEMPYAEANRRWPESFPLSNDQA